MDFELSDEQQLIRQTARAFCDAEIAPHAAEWDRNEAIDRGILPAGVVDEASRIDRVEDLLVELVAEGGERHRRPSGGTVAMPATLVRRDDNSVIARRRRIAVIDVTALQCPRNRNAIGET